MYITYSNEISGRRSIESILKTTFMLLSKMKYVLKVKTLGHGF